MWSVIVLGSDRAIASDFCAWCIKDCPLTLERKQACGNSLQISDLLYFFGIHPVMYRWFQSVILVPVKDRLDIKLNIKGHQIKSIIGKTVSFLLI